MIIISVFGCSDFIQITFISLHLDGLAGHEATGNGDKNEIEALFITSQPS